MPVVSLAQGRQVGRDLARRHGGQIDDRRRREPCQVTIEIAAVRAQRVAGEGALDGQVVEVATDRATQRGGRLGTTPTDRRVHIVDLRMSPPLRSVSREAHVTAAA